VCFVLISSSAYSSTVKMKAKYSSETSVYFRRILRIHRTLTTCLFISCTWRWYLYLASDCNGKKCNQKIVSVGCASPHLAAEFMDCSTPKDSLHLVTIQA
jgi:hypothetical protein